MTLIKSISGIRGTIGGKPGDGLTPVDVVKFSSAFASFIIGKTGNRKIVIGRDARLSGEMVSQLVTGSLTGMGVEVVDLGLSTTPTVEIAVTEEKAGGGIILTASHNPKEWNALKLLNEKGEFISGEEGKEVLEIADRGDFYFSPIDQIGSYRKEDSYIQKHIQKIISLPLVEVKTIAGRNYKVVVDAVNSTGGIAVPALLRALGVKDIIELNCEPTGKFAHNPEPLPENLKEISKEVVRCKADLGIVVDPDVDRLALVCADGSMFGEEYTLVAVADYILKNKKGNTVSNLSSTRALRDVTETAGGQYFSSAVGEVHVVKKMKEVKAVIGGEGNGGIIYPELHYGRDALAGIALFLTHLAKSGKSAAQLRASYPNYFISKNKMELKEGMEVGTVLSGIMERYKQQPLSTVDGVKIEFEKNWVHLRSSNTEPIIRIYAESSSEKEASALAEKIIDDIKELI